MKKQMIVNLLTGNIAKLVRYALAGIGTAIGNEGLKSNDGTEIAVAIVAVVFPLVWSWLEDRARSNAMAKAILNVIDGDNPQATIDNTATLNKVDIEKNNKPKEQ